MTRLQARGRPLEVAEWLREGASVVSGADDTVAVLREALGIYEGCGAAASAAEVRDQLDRVGASVDDQPAVSGWRSLTPTETAVAELLAHGLTNAEIARERGGSRRTVEAHLRRIYAKLQIDGRVKLTVAATEQFGRPPS